MEEQILVACIVVFPSFPGARRVKINDIYNQASAELTIVTEMFSLYRSMWSFFLASRPFYGLPSSLPLLQLTLTPLLLLVRRRTALRLHNITNNVVWFVHYEHQQSPSHNFSIFNFLLLFFLFFFLIFFFNFRFYLPLSLSTSLPPHGHFLGVGECGRCKPKRLHQQQELM